MDKIEMYNKIVDVTRNTGQGVSNIIGKLEPSYQILLDELENDDMVDTYNVSGDIFYFPKGCFSPFKNGMNHELTYIRVYLGINDIGLGLKRMDFLLKPEYKEKKLKYDNWISKNISELEKMRNWPYYGETNENDIISSELQKDTINFIKSRNWYKENLTLFECITECKNGYNNDLSNINICNRIIELYNIKTRYKNEYKYEIDEQYNDIKKYTTNKKFRDNFLEWSKYQTNTENIQTIIK